MRYEFTPEDIDWFWSKVDRTDADGCWPWRGGTNVNGYGIFYFRRGWSRKLTFPRMAHRISYAINVADVPAGLNVLHRCDNPPCCNPGHLYPGTQRDNVADMIERGRQDFSTLRRPGATHNKAKLTEDDVRAIRERYRPRSRGDDPGSSKALALCYGVGQKTIRNVARRETWKECE